ncbi:MAG: hypothetical protein KF773_16475 [Deltaproteobacteria bacterium]|nr:hypothetical protein [Deltaproteobacteria bacterium]
MSRIALCAAVAYLTLPGCLVGDSADVTTPVELAPPEDVPPANPPAPGNRAGIVLAHGLGGTVDSFDPAIVTALQADGFYVLRDSVPGVDSVAVRAAALKTQIDAFVANNQLDKVHVFAHSMGGLDARYLLSTLKAPAVVSLTTVSTPHRGSVLADLGLGLQRRLSVSQQEALLMLTDVLGDRFSPAQLEAALTDLAEANAGAFNAANPDVAGVAYYSIAGYASVGGFGNPNADAACAAAGATVPAPSSLPSFLKLTGPVVAGEDRRPHDGIVAVASAAWTGFLGCIPTDHLDETRAAEKPAADMRVDLVKLYRDAAARVK